MAASTKKFLDENGLLYYDGKIKGRLNTKVDKETGKGLSTNDLTNELKQVYDETVTKVDQIIAEGGEPNVIETVKVNGTALTPDAEKAVNIDLNGYAKKTDLPTKVSELTNDGDGTTGSKFATEAYVNTNGGKIDKIKVNGTEQAITNKAVDIKVPTKTSDLTNNSNFVSDASYVHIDVDSALSGSSSNPVENQAIHTALAGKLDTTLKGANSGLAELDANGKVPTSQLPSFVDDVVEADNYDSLPIEGETGKIYVTLDTNKTYRWSGSAYVEISESLALGTTSSTAFRGDYGQTAYTHATDSGKLTTATAAGMYKVGATAEGHISALTAITAADIEGILSFASDLEIDSLFGIAN